MRIVVLAGGVGGARFLRGLRRHLGAEGVDTARDVTAVVNTGDDMWLAGVRVTPDLDSVMYTLGGGIDEERGWGRRDESERVSAELSAYGVGWPWFTLGDLDLGTHLARTALLREGLPLSAVVQRLCERWQPGIRLLPMTDDEVETHVRVVEDGVEKLLHFEEWWVRLRAGLPALAFEQPGVDASRPAPGVLEAIAAADAVLLAPSNPVVSIGTILAVPGVREALRSTPARIVGVSPIIGGAPVRGMAGACLSAIGVATTADAVALHYGARHEGGLLDGWLIDDADAALAPALTAAGIATAARPTLMTDEAAAARIAGEALALAAR